MNQSYTKSLKVANFKDKSCDIVEFLSIDNQVLNQKSHKQYCCYRKIH